MLIRLQYSNSYLFILLCVFLFQIDQSLAANKCYSCASENMRENFLNRQRGPQKRVTEPKLYDNMCDLDTWLIREKSVVECAGQCFKWQQIVNNSGPVVDVVLWVNEKKKTIKLLSYLFGFVGTIKDIL